MQRFGNRTESTPDGQGGNRVLEPDRPYGQDLAPSRRDHRAVVLADHVGEQREDTVQCLRDPL